MTLWDLLRAFVRRWPLVLAGGLLTLTAAWAVTLDDGVYWTRTEVVFLAPSSEMFPNSLQTRSGDLIITAGIVAKRVLGPQRIVKYASPEATIVGATSIRDGYWIRLPDTGGQWATNFASQTLLVEVVGPSTNRVSELQQEVLGRIAHELDALQRELKVDSVNDIHVTVAPESTVIHLIKGSRPRAWAMIGLLGVGLTTAATMLAEHRARRRTGGSPSGLIEPEHSSTAPAASSRQRLDGGSRGGI